MFVEHLPKFGQKQAKKPLTFHMFKAGHQKSFVATPCWPRIGVFEIDFFRKKQHSCWTPKNLKSGKNKDKEREFEWKKKTEIPQNWNDWWKTNFKIWYVDVVLFLQEKQRNKNKKERDKRQGTRRKQNKKEKKEGRTNGRRERQRKRKWKRVRKKTKEKKGETLKTKQKCLFGGKQAFCY